MTTDCFVCDGLQTVEAANVADGKADWDNHFFPECPHCYSQTLLGVIK